MRNLWILAACLSLAACGNPLSRFDRLSDTGLGGGPQASVRSAEAEAPLLDNAAEAAGEVEARAVAAAAARAEARPPRGLLAMLGFGGGAAGVPDSGAAARATPVAAGQSAPPAVAGRGPDAQEVAAGTALPYGSVARVCNLPDRRRGTRIATIAGFAVYDTIPNTTAPRPHYITGFRDGCARTFTGALVLTGDVGTHEVVRYQPSNNRIGYNETDEAYERIKRRVCGAGRGQPCGARIDQLARNTAFLTIYESFGGGGAEWVEILLHDRGLAAIDFKS